MVNRVNLNRKKKKIKKQNAKANAGAMIVRQPRGGGLSPQDRANLVHMVCAMTDPFCDHANGVRWSNDGIVQTVTFAVRQRLALTTGAGGIHQLVFCPSNSTLFYQNTSSGFAPFTVLGSGSSYLTSIQLAGNVQQLRPISAGLRWWDVSPATSAGGSVTLIEYPTLGSLINEAVTDGDGNQGTAVQITDRRTPGAWISKANSPLSYNFNNFVITGTGGSNPRTCCALSVNGTASTLVLNVEMVIHYEATIDANNILTGMAERRDDSPAKQFAVKAAKIVESRMPTFIEGTKARIGKTIENVALRAIGGLLGSFVGGPLGGAIGSAIGGGVGMIMDVD